MRRFLGLWLLLAAVLALATFGVSIGAYRRLDVRFDVFLRIALVPVLQAGALALLDGGLGRLRARLLSGLRLRFPLLLATAGGLAIAAWAGLLIDGPLGPGRARGLTAAAALLATFSSLALLRAAPLAAAWLGLLAASAVVPWPSLAAQALPGPPLLRGLLVSGGAWLLTLDLALRAGARLEGRRAGAGVYLDAAAACAFAGGLVVGLGFLLHPFLVPPWDVVAPALAALAALLALAGAAADRP